MSFGKMNIQIDIIQTVTQKDSEGFATQTDTVLASVRAYREERHGSERWANQAVFQNASALFRFRRIPSLIVTTKMTIVCMGERFRILSAEDVRGRKMYIEVLTEKLEPSVR
jgi:SPP1 family predicted phage head-tail adaptor